MTPPDPEHSLNRLLIVLIAVGIGLRLALMLMSVGTNDIMSWLDFAQAVRDSGLAATYRDRPLFNHPPLMGWLSVLALRISDATSLHFALVFKIPSLVAEGVTAFLLYRIWDERSGRDAGLQAAAAYAVALCSILISGYHGNTDAIYFCLALGAAYLMESKEAPFWAGLALAGALNVKLIPLVAVLPLWSRCTHVRDAGRYALGGLVGALPFLLTLAVFSPADRRVFLERLLLYRSNQTFWGIESIVLWGRALSELAARGLGEGFRTFGQIVRAAGDLHIAYGTEFVLVATALLGLRQLLLARGVALDAYALTLLGFALFLTLGPGFGVQYVGCVVAPLIAIDVRRGLIVATINGVFIASIYVYWMVDWSPMYSVYIGFPWWLSPLGLLAWGSVLWACRDLLGTRRARSPATDRSRTQRRRRPP